MLALLCRLLSLAEGLPQNAPPQQHLAAEGALNLALRLGVAPRVVLNRLLGEPKQVSLYEAYRPAIHAWLIFNARACAGQLLEALAGAYGPPQHAQHAQRAAGLILNGCLESLQRSRDAQAGRADVRQRYDLMLPWLIREGESEGEGEREGVGGGQESGRGRERRRRRGDGQGAGEEEGAAPPCTNKHMHIALLPSFLSLEREGEEEGGAAGGRGGGGRGQGEGTGTGTGRWRRRGPLDWKQQDNETPSHYVKDCFMLWAQLLAKATYAHCTTDVFFGKRP